MLLKFNRSTYKAGNRYKRGEVAEVANEKHAKLFTTTIVDGAPIAVEVDLSTLETEEETDENEGELEWDIDMSPEDYLARYPNGPRAKLAQKILELMDNGEEEEDDEK